MSKTSERGMNLKKNRLGGNIKKLVIRRNPKLLWETVDINKCITILIGKEEKEIRNIIIR